MYSFVHNKTRNRLAVEKAESLVYIYTNSRVLRQRPGADPVRWYDLNNLSEDSDPDALGPIPVHEVNREFDAMQAEDAEEAEVEVNRAPPTYEANRNVWRQGIDHLEEARNYYGDDDGLDDDVPIGWTFRNARHSLSPSLPRSPPNERVVEPNVYDFPESDNEAISTNPVDNQSLANEDDMDRNEENGSPTNAHANRNEEDNAHGGHIPNIEAPSNEDLDHGNVGNVDGSLVGQPLRNNTFEPENHGTTAMNVERIDTGATPATNVRIDVHSLEDNDLLSNWIHRRVPRVTSNRNSAQAHNTLGEHPRSHQRPPNSNPISRPHREGLGSVGNAEVSNLADGSRGCPPPTVLRGQYGVRHEDSGEGGNIAGASSSRPTKRNLRGIGVRLPGQVIEPFLQTYTPGPTSSTPAFVVHGTRRGPLINSDAEDPTARRHKRFRKTQRQGRRIIELRNENSEFEGQRSAEEEEGESEEEGVDEDVNDEAPADDDVLIPRAHMMELSTRGIRRSSRLNITTVATEENEGM